MNDNDNKSVLFHDALPGRLYRLNGISAMVFSGQHCGWDYDTYFVNTKSYSYIDLLLQEARMDFPDVDVEYLPGDGIFLCLKLPEFRRGKASFQYIMPILFKERIWYLHGARNIPLLEIK